MSAVGGTSNKRFVESTSPTVNTRTQDRWLTLLRIQCTPVDRPWPERKCDRCLAKGLPCGPNVRCRKRSRGGVSEGVSDPTAPTTPSNLIGTNLPPTPPSSGSHRSCPAPIAVHHGTIISPTNLQGSPTLRFGKENTLRAATLERTDVTRNRRSLSCKYAKSFHAS
jgi:hypothetical protein